jgi:hypothetical protein
MSTVIVALLLLPIALALVVALLALLARPLLVPVIAWFERGRFQRCLARAARGDAHLQAHNVEAALREFEAAFCLMTVRADPRLAEQMARHHIGLLSRLLAVVDDLPRQRVRLLALAKAERLLGRRAEMQRAYLQLASRPPRDVRRRQLGQELRRNAGETRRAVRELIGDLQLISSRKVAYQ